MKTLPNDCFWEIDYTCLTVLIEWKTLHKYQFFIAGICFLYSITVTAEEEYANLPFATPAEINAQHVFALVSLIEKEVDSIRHAMGKPNINRNIVHIHGAAPREVLYQAVSLQKKIQRLNFELTFSRSRPPEIIPLAKSGSESIWQTLVESLQNLYEIKRRYNILARHQFPAITDKKSPSDVYMSILRINRQVNVLLAQPYLPSDVYQETTTALYYTLSLQEKIPGLRLLKEPEFVPGNMPRDVYAEMLSMYKDLSKLLSRSNIKTLTLKAIHSEKIQPSDVYDIIVLINSQLAYLHARTKGVRGVHPAVYPGVKFPSHVLQRARFLHLHIRKILTTIQKNPNLLSLRN
jgi:hypothetical protein